MTPGAYLNPVRGRRDRTPPTLPRLDLDRPLALALARLEKRLRDPSTDLDA
jgi:hypothetical protein